MKISEPCQVRKSTISNAPTDHHARNTHRRTMISEASYRFAFEPRVRFIFRNYFRFVRVHAPDTYRPPPNRVILYIFLEMTSTSGWHRVEPHACVFGRRFCRLEPDWTRAVALFVISFHFPIRLLGPRCVRLGNTTNTPGRQMGLTRL